MDGVVFWAVVSARVLVPLGGFRFPLPATLAALVFDGLDQSIFQAFGIELEGYQSYDKALDVYYLSLAYLAMMRNWVNQDAFDVGRFLYYFRLVGVVLFEQTQIRALLLVFPNTIEYFFDAFEAIRTRWDPRRLARAALIGLAAFIWIFIKLPQEWWIHVAQLDFTDAVRDHVWFGVAVVVAILVGLAVLWFVVRPRLRPPDHPLQVRSESLPGGLDRGEVRRAGRLARGTVFNLLLLEKVVFVTLVTAIFASILPSVDASTPQITLAVAVFVIVDSAVGLAAARVGRGFDTAWASFLALAAVNLLAVLLVRFATPGESPIALPVTAFFVLLLTLIVSLYDRYAPVNALRRREWDSQVRR